LAFHQQAANQLGGDELGGAGEERLGEVTGGRGGYGDGLGGRKWSLFEVAWEAQKPHSAGKADSLYPQNLKTSNPLGTYPLPQTASNAEQITNPMPPKRK